MSFPDKYLSSRYVGWYDGRPVFFVADPGPFPGDGCVDPTGFATTPCGTLPTTLLYTAVSQNGYEPVSVRFPILWNSAKGQWEGGLDPLPGQAIGVVGSVYCKGGGNLVARFVCGGKTSDTYLSPPIVNNVFEKATGVVDVSTVCGGGKVILTVQPGYILE